MEGNQKAMREALEFADRELRMATEDDRYGDDLVYLVGCMRSVADVCRAALSAPARNCDVGTAEEQMKRQHDTMCNTTRACPDSDWTCKKCFAEWEQMPYDAEEGAADE